MAAWSKDEIAVDILKHWVVELVMIILPYFLNMPLLCAALSLPAQQYFFIKSSALNGLSI